MSDKAAPAFISYSRVDTPFVLRLTRDLKAAGADVWLDQIDIQLGQAWDDAIEHALKAAPQMLLVLSPASAKSPNVRDEIGYALDHGRIVIPILYQDCDTPLRLQRTQRLDFRTEYGPALATLLEHLGKSPVAETAPVRQPQVKAAAAMPGPPPLAQPAKVKAGGAGLGVVAGAAADEVWEYKDATPVAQDEVAALDRLGQAGWEMTGFSGGVMTLRRPAGEAPRPVWQYQRVTGPLALARRTAFEQRGWTFAGTWAHSFHYFKRAAGL